VCFGIQYTEQLDVHSCLLAVERPS